MEGVRLRESSSFDRGGLLEVFDQRAVGARGEVVLHLSEADAASLPEPRLASTLRLIGWRRYNGASAGGLRRLITTRERG
jgi:hypothetical protein